ncbi:Guanine nucleotide exchange factor for Cdc42p [Coemansia sp. RSA 1813]|nr:Guanine nucleotide exchange factor for Cdc42p [Coemansia sp. RSA 1646]KAJ1766911.1 Guanine nucleotide exchange factor for Cdc42p [Coemansia sp. RSA 1843]KAJ2088986.1 Guanine nucleotide exchange factor for Cdc42p [Coemansia sp. RSA 986]KAJ2210654.1 Guanine nucleotide exchange factor for Cdc42p [Coemansia sp. RSA 487]KAJ2569472.1 Guanine nucleotide exchange factor for Cdc42p [Coemansia sp. RSA 1813]
MALSRRLGQNSANAAPPMEASTPTQNTDSVLNRNTPATSIYQTSVNLLDKLACIEGFEVYLASLFDESALGKANGSSTPYLNPIQLLWDTFRQGTSLCVIYNALKPAEPLSTTLDESQNILRQRKDRVYRFVKACKDNQIVREEDLFTISELFKDDTNSFVKVLKTIETVVDTVQSRGLLDTSRLVEKPSARFAEAQLGPPQDNRDRVVKEFVETERRYVQDLELLQGYMEEVHKKNIISSDSLRYIFANLNSLVDFQRRFLIGVEANASQPPEDQHFGAVFINMKEGFMVYEPYCANYARASKLCVAEEDSLRVLAHIIEPHYELPSMLIKPVQRMCKYPMILEELTKFYEVTSPIYLELRDGISAINSIVEQVNEAERKEGNLAVVSDLEERVENWKGYSITTFGELFLHDTFVMSTTGVERELLIYLFENILICCKEMTEKDKRRNQKHKSNALHLKGRIFLFSIHSVVDTTRDNQLNLTIYWRDVVMENFSLACRSEEQLRIWKSTMERLIARTREKAASAIEGPQSSPANVQMSQRSASSQQSTEYDSDDEVTLPRRDRFSEGSSLTTSMQQEKGSHMLAYRKTYDGTGPRVRNGSTKKQGSTDYTNEPMDGVERSATISTFHRRLGANGSNGGINDTIDPAYRNRSSPMPAGSMPTGPMPAGPMPAGPMPAGPMPAGPMYGKSEVPPVPSFHRTEGSDGIAKSIPSSKAPGTITINPPMPTAFASSISPMTPGTAGLPGSAMSISSTPVPQSASPQGMNGAGGGAPTRPVKVKVHFLNDIFVIIIKQDVPFRELVERVDRKIKICAGPHVGISGSNENDIATAPLLDIRMRYQDEDGDMILVSSDEDVQMAFESANAARKDETATSTLNLFVSI